MASSAGCGPSFRTRPARKPRSRPQWPASRQLVPWPKDLPAQIAAVRDLLTSAGNSTGTWTLDRTARAFKGAKRPQIEAVLNSLAALGLLVTFETPQGRQWRAAT